MRVMIAVFIVGLLGCSGNTGMVPTEDGAWDLSLEPEATPENVSPVVALMITSRNGAPDPSDLILIEGEISAASLQRYRERETTETLAERVIPSRVEASPKTLILRPQQLLLTGQRYSVIAREGVVARFLVGADFGVGYLTRVWPPRDSSQATAQSIYCGSSAPTQPTTAALFPSGVTAEILPGIDRHGLASGSCVRVIPQISMDSPLQLQPPPRVLGYALEPSAFRAGVARDQVASRPCSGSETSIGPGCLEVENGRAIVRGPAAPTFWAVSSALGWRSLVVPENSSFAFPVSSAEVGLNVQITVFDLSGRSMESSIDIAGVPAAGHVILNEVMSNPSGPEPAEEWIELLNAGDDAAEMVGWKLCDEGSQVELPPMRLEPRAFVLLVRSDYVGGVANDVPPASETALVRLSQLGKSGLLNSGESLRLVDALGRLVSTFPGIPSSRDGVSVARRDPLTLDDEKNGFAPHAFPGSSPGEPNSVE